MKQPLSGLAVLSLLASVVLGGCGPGKTAVTLAGSTAFQPAAVKLADQYMKSHPTVNVTVQGGGSTLGIQAALSGVAQIGMVDMVDLPPEAASLQKVTVASDGIAMVVHPTNQVAALTTDQIRAIFNGTIANWKEVGGADQPITVVSRELGSGTRASFEQIVKEVALARGAVVQMSNGTVRETVANDPNAIGYLSHGLLNEKVKAVTVDGVTCTEDEIHAGRYALVRPIFLVTKSAPQGEIRNFVDFVLSAEGQKIIRGSNLLPAR